jgi:hypothetical protein
MAYNFLSLVNDVNGRLNEVPLTSANFPAAVGFYKQAKDAVNAALNDIYQDAFEWPFTHTTATLPLVVNQTRYSYPVDAKSINFDSFRIKGDDNMGVATTPLRQMDYEEYLSKFADADYNGFKYANIPKVIFRAPNFQFGVFPPARATWDLVYEYYRLPLELELHGDVPALPEQFRHLITDGATHYSYMFRGDPESAAVMLEKFNAGLKNARKIYQNRFEYLRSGYNPLNGKAM